MSENTMQENERNPRNGFKFFDNYYANAKRFKNRAERAEFVLEIVEFYYEGIEPQFEDEDGDAAFYWGNVRHSVAASRRQSNRNQGAPMGNNNSPHGRAGNNPQNNPQNKQYLLEQEYEIEREGKVTSHTVGSVVGGLGEGGKDGADAPARSLSWDFLEFQDWVRENAPSVANRQFPFTERQYQLIMRDWPNDAVYDVLLSLENTPNLRGKSAYTLCLSWLTARKRQGTLHETRMLQEAGFRGE